MPELSTVAKLRLGSTNPIFSASQNVVQQQQQEEQPANYRIRTCTTTATTCRCQPPPHRVCRVGPSKAGNTNPQRHYQHPPSRGKTNRGRSDGRSPATASHAHNPSQTHADPSTIIPTTPGAGTAGTGSASAALAAASYHNSNNNNTHDPETNPRLPSIYNQPIYPGARSSPTPPPAAALRDPRVHGSTAAAVAHRQPQPSSSRFPRPQAYFLQSPFRKGPIPSSQPRRSGPRLWNPTNSTPRGSNQTTLAASHKAKDSNATATTTASAARPKRARDRRPSTPPPPSVPLHHPSLNTETKDPGGTSEPLLSLPEQRQTKLPPSTRASLQIDRDNKRISLPRSVRHSYDSKGGATPVSANFPTEVLKELRQVEQNQKEEVRHNTQLENQTEITIAGPSNPQLPEPFPSANHPVKPLPSNSTGFRKRGHSISNKFAEATSTFGLRLDRTNSAGKSPKGKGKMPATRPETLTEGSGAPDTFSPDLEQGADYSDPNRMSGVSGIGPALTDSDSSSIMGDPDQADPGIDEWGPVHPCFPHLNPHVSVDSPEYVTTRIIRVKRDWLIQGDLAPTFSNLYPEILDPAGVPEQEFRRVIEKLNKELVPTFNPYGWRNVMDGVMGLVTGWLWDDFGFSAVKGRLAKLEKWIQEWNEEMKRQAGEDAHSVPQLVPLRRTAYMALDIQILDPEIAPALSTSGRSRDNEPAPIESIQEPAPAIIVS